MVRYLMAVTHAGNRNTQLAKSSLGEAIKADPKWDEARLLLAEIQLKRRQH